VVIKVWILNTLHHNDDTSRLHSIDIQLASVKSMDPKFQKRWEFQEGYYQDLLKSGKLCMDKFDFIFIDAIHTEEFVRGYCQDILNPHTQNVIVAIHNIVGDATR
jgi:predicted O-methyltransferase YrrM